MSDYDKLDELYVYLSEIARKHNVNMESKFHHLNNFFEYISLSQDINPLELVSEEDVLLRDINTEISKNEAEKEIVFLISFANYLDNYLLFQ